MYDPDQQSPVLRLGSISKTPSLTTSERLALAERQMEEAVARWSEAFIAWQAERRQSQPISAVQSRHTAEEIEHYSATHWTEDQIATLEHRGLLVINRIKTSDESVRQNVGDGAVRF